MKILKHFLKKTFKKGSISNDYTFFAGCTVLFLVIVCSLIVYNAKESFIRGENYRLVQLSNRVKNRFKYILDENHSMLSYIGRQISHLDTAREKQKIAKFLRETDKIDAKVMTTSYVGWADTDGDIVVTAKHGTVKKGSCSIAHRSYFQACRKKPWSLQISQDEKSVFKGSWVLPISVGVTNDKNIYIGQVTLGLRVPILLNLLEEKFTDIHIEAGRHFIILDHDFNILMTSTNTSLTTEEQSNFFKPRLRKLNLVEKPSGKFEAPINSKYISFGHYQKIPDYPFIILTGHNIPLLNSNFHLSILPRILEFLGIAIFFLTLLHFFRRKIVKPIIEFSDTATEIAAGKLPTKIARQNSTEMTNLAKALLLVARYIRRNHRFHKTQDKALKLPHLSSTERSAFIKKLSQDHLLTFIEKVPVCVAMLDKDLKFVMVSEHWKKEFPSQKLWVLTHIQETLPCFIKVWDKYKTKCFEGEIIKIEEHYFPLHKEKATWFRLEFQAWYEKGKAAGILLFLDNITQRKEQKLKKEELIADLSRSNSDLERFAYICTHDLKEPLRSISSFAQLIRTYKGKRINKEIEQYLDLIISNISKMHKLIYSVLSYSQLGAKKLQLKNISVGAVIEQVKGSLKAAIEEKRAKIITKNLPPDLLADETLLGQLFLNLISNALKYADESVPLIIEIEAINKEDSYEFHVKDTGIGISPAYFDKIFLPFESLHAYEKYQGTGIGLAICKKIVESHQGKIWVDSKLHKGTTFSFTLHKFKTSPPKQLSA